MSVSGNRIFSIDHSREGYLEGFWGWVRILESGDFDGAAKSMGDGHGFTGTSLKERIETFFGTDPRLKVIVPNSRLVDVVNEAAEIQLPENDQPGWMLAMIPLTDEPGRAKEDDVMLMGAAVSFFVVEREGALGLQFEIFQA